MRILIHGAYFPPDQIGIGKYTGEMAAWLAAQGHEVRVVVSQPFYPAWRITEGYSGGRYTRERWQGLDLWRCPVWVPDRQTGATRIMHLLSFALSSAPVVLRQVFWRPDLVCIVAPPFFCAPAAWAAARLARARAWLHLQDFEVDAAFETGLLRQPDLRRFAIWVERVILRRFDRVSTVSRTMLARLVDKGVPNQHCLLFPNWVDLDAITPLQGSNSFRNELTIAEDMVVALYSGSIGYKQGLETVLDAARRLEGDSGLRFVICGEGPLRERLSREYASLTNVIWLPLQPMSRLNELLNMADIHLLPQRADVADLVMPSKLTGMLASGRPVVATAVSGTQIAEVVSSCGIVVQPGDDAALATAIQKLAADRGEMRRLGAAARKYAVEHLGADRVLRQLEHEMGALTGKRA